MISQTAEYALRAMVVIAQQYDNSILTNDIAARTQVPPGYLAKVLQALGRAGLVKSQRGIGGGFALMRPAREITVLEVVNAVDPVKRIERCPLNIQAHGTDLCPLHRELDQAAGLVENAFSRCTLEQLLKKDALGPALCKSAAEPVSAASKLDSAKSPKSNP